MSNTADMLRRAIDSQGPNDNLKPPAAAMAWSAINPDFGGNPDDDDDLIRKIRAYRDETKQILAEKRARKDELSNPPQLPSTPAGILRETIQGGDRKHIPLNGAGVLTAMLRGIGGGGTINGG